MLKSSATRGGKGLSKSGTSPLFAPYPASRLPRQSTSNNRLIDQEKHTKFAVSLAHKLASYYPSYTARNPIPSGPDVPFLAKEAVLSIFWTLRIVRPMSPLGGYGLSRVPTLSVPPDQTREDKESPDMKRPIFSVMTLVVLAALAGCATERGRHPLFSSHGGCATGEQTCQTSEGCCGDPAQCAADPEHACRFCKERLCRARCQEAPPAAGPAAGAITYPYYTIRGPRDYLAKKPLSIGP